MISRCGLRTSSHVKEKRGFFFLQSNRSGGSYLACSCERWDLFSLFSKMVTLSSPRSTSKLGQEVCVCERLPGLQLTQKTASELHKVLSELCFPDDSLYTCKLLRHFNTRWLRNVLLTPNMCLHKIPKPQINLWMTMLEMWGSLQHCGSAALKAGADLSGFFHLSQIGEPFLRL